MPLGRVPTVIRGSTGTGCVSGASWAPVDTARWAIAVTPVASTAATTRVGARAATVNRAREKRARAKNVMHELSAEWFVLIAATGSIRDARRAGM